MSNRLLEIDKPVRRSTILDMVVKYSYIVTGHKSIRTRSQVRSGIGSIIKTSLYKKPGEKIK